MLEKVITSLLNGESFDIITHDDYAVGSWEMLKGDQDEFKSKEKTTATEEDCYPETSEKIYQGGNW